MSCEIESKKERKQHKAIPGKASMFRGKVRAPVSLTLTPDHHAKVKSNMARLGLSRADFIALLIDRYADSVQRDQPMEAQSGQGMMNSTSQIARGHRQVVHVS